MNSIWEKIQTPRPNTTPNTNPGPPVSWNDPSNPDDPQAGYGYIPNDTTKEETFFYHSDHLGSTSYITDDKANITQYDAYLPYGELLVDEHSSSEEMPYKFNGKQFDEETGLYYYGARYLNPVTSLWYGVDPMAEKYNSIGGYVYCIGNPLKNTDPDGRKVRGVTKQDAEKFRDDIYRVLADDKFTNIRTLIDIKGKEFRNIDTDKLDLAMKGIALSNDESAYITIVANTINSKDVYNVEYVSGNYTSSQGAKAFVVHMNKVVGNGIGDKMVTSDGKLSTAFIRNSGDGLNVPTSNGSHSFIGSSLQGNERAVTSGHEVFGHGIPAAKKLTPAENNANAIRTENLIRRILKLPQNDGSKHGGYKEGHINNPYILPILK